MNDKQNREQNSKNAAPSPDGTFYDQQKRAQALRVRVQLRHDLLELADGRVDRVDLAEEQRELGVLFLGLAEERLEPGRGVRELAVLGRGEVVQPLEQAELVERRCVSVRG